MVDNADIDAIGVNVSGMTSMDNVFDIAGRGSSAMVQNLEISNNDFAGVNPPIRWTGANVRDEAEASFSNVAVSNNSNIRHIFSAVGDSVLMVEDVFVSGAIGGRVVVSFWWYLRSKGTLFSRTDTVTFPCRNHWMLVQSSLPTLVRRSQPIKLKWKVSRSLP